MLTHVARLNAKASPYLILTLSYLVVSMGIAQAQTTISFDPPDLKLVDDAGINVISGKPQARLEPVSIGPKDSGLIFKLDFNGETTRIFNADGFYGDITPVSVWEAYMSSSSNLEVRLFNESDIFLVGSSTNRRKTGSKLELKNDGSYEYTSRDGVRYITNPAIKSRGVGTAITKVVYPNGREINISRSTGAGTPVHSVTTNNGYQLRYSYDTAGNLIKVTAVNLAVDYCDPTASDCSYSRPWPFATLLWDRRVVNGVGPTTLTITDASNRVTKYLNEDVIGFSSGSTRLTSIKWPSSPAADNVTIKYAKIYTCTADDASLKCSDLRDSVDFVDIGNSHWAYSYRQESKDAPYQAGLDGIWVTTVTSPAGLVTQAHYDVRRNVTHWITTNGRISQTYGVYNRVETATDIEGRNFSFDYDDRGNILSKTQNGTNGSGALILKAGYDNVCNNFVTCNKPNWVMDANGNQTDYTYDPIHGAVLTETSAPDANGIRPQKRYKYIQRTARIKNTAGGDSPAGPPIWMLDTVSYCRTSNVSSTGTGCQVANDEVVTSYDYGSLSGPNNLQLRGAIVTADGVSRRVCYAYDALGNMISETTANAARTSCN